MPESVPLYGAFLASVVASVVASMVASMVASVVLAARSREVLSLLLLLLLPLLLIGVAAEVLTSEAKEPRGEGNGSEATLPFWGLSYLVSLRPFVLKRGCPSGREEFRQLSNQERQPR